MPRYEGPVVPTSPVLPGSRAAHWIASTLSAVWRGPKSSKVPPDEPVPRTSTIACM
jgi:hypothetical protein